MIGMKRILRVKWLAFWFALVIIMGLSGCEKSEPLPVEVQIEFSADRTTIQPGECARLTWRVEGGFGVSLNGEGVPKVGEREACPGESRPFELAVDAGTHLETRTIEITVGGEMDQPEIDQELATPIQPEERQETVISGMPAYQADTWVRLGGPPGGLGYDIRMDPRNPDVLFVTASPGGIFKSLDGGQTWIAQNQGLEAYPGSGASIFCATIDPHDPDTIWIGTQFNGHVYRSTDGGQTWQERDKGILEKVGENSIRGITIDPNNPDVVYVAMERGTGLGGVTGEVYKSTDRGESFSLIWQGQSLARYVWVDPRNSQRLYVSTGIFDQEAANSDPDNLICGGEGIVRSDDGGQT